MIPLNNKEAEIEVLGSMIQDPSCLPIALAKIFRDCFYTANHQLVFDAILKLYDRNTGIDITTVVEELKRYGNLETIGGPYEIMKLTNSVIFANNIEAHCMILMELYLKRQTAFIGRTLEQSGCDVSKDAFDGLNEAAALITQASETVLKGAQKSMGYYVTKVIEQRDRVMATGHIGLDTGFDSLNQLISGWVNPDLIIVAARPGMGKTAFIVSSIHYLSVIHQIPVAVFSLEMSGEQLTQRLESIDSGIYHSVLRNNKLSTDEREKLPYTHDRLVQAPIYIEDKPGINIRELRTKANILKRRNGIKAVFVDYLQLMSGVDEKGKSRENVISEISRGCKLIAKELDIPVIALSQLSRAVESRADRMPQLSDLRESGSIEQDADEVIFLMRPEYYDMKIDIVIDGIEYNKQGLVICKIDKNRHGSTKIIPLKFQPELMKYSDYEKISRFVPVNQPGW